MRSRPATGGEPCPTSTSSRPSSPTAPTSSAMTEPSTAWREVVAPDEERRHARQAEAFTAMQLRKSTEFGVGRALHRRQRLALRAVLDVPAELPSPARHGIFAAEASYDVW